MLNERKLTERELDKRTEAIQGLLSNKRTLVKKYGKDAEKVMYGIATKQAKNKVEGMNKDKIKELIQTALQKEETTSSYPDFDLDKNIKYQDTSISSGMWRYTGKEQGGKGVYRNLSNDQFLGFSSDDFAFFKKHLGSHFDMSESLEEANIGLADLEEIGYTDGDKAVAMHFNQDVVGINSDVDYKSYRKGFIQGVIDNTQGFSLDERVDKIDELLDEGIDFDEALNLRAIKAELEGEIQGVRMEMEDEGDESKADYYGDILNRFESRLAKVQGQLDDYDMNENSTPQNKDYYADYQDIGQFYLEGFGKEHTLNSDQLEELGKKIVKQLYKGDVGKAYDDIVGRFRNKPKDIKEDDKMHSTFEDYIDELEKTMYVDRRDGGKIFIHPLDKPGVRRPSKDYISISGNNITAVQGYNSGPIQDLADAYSSLSVDKDSRLVPMGKDYASGKASLLSSNILVDAIKAIEASRDAEAKNQQAYYRKNPKKGRIGYGLSSQPRMNEKLAKPEEKKLKKIKKELEGASKMHAGQAKKIAKIVKEKLTKGSSVEDHVEDFKDSDAPQFKGKSKDKKVQMAVASYLSKQGKSIKENMVADKDIEKEIKLLQDENPKGFEKEIKKLKVRQAALKLSK